MIAPSPTHLLNDDSEQDNDQARVAAIKVFKGSEFPRNTQPDVMTDQFTLFF